MADVVAGERYVEPERDERRQQVAHKALLTIIVALVLVIILQVVYHLVIAPRLSIAEIELHNGLSLPDDELLQLAGVRLGMTYFQARPDEIGLRIERHPEVQSASVERVFPNRLVVSATRRRPLAAAVVQTASGAKTLVFDEQGVVFQIGAGALAQKLPVLSGLRFPEAALGLELPPVLTSFLSQLRSMQQNHPELHALFSEYRVVRLNNHAFEVVLYPMHFTVPVRIGTSIDREMVEYILMMLDLLRAQGELDNVVELDFRGRDGVVVYEEAAGGR
ncbi:MAG: cell division protein FtsQ/DivIB [Spirochaetales bacterium]